MIFDSKNFYNSLKKIKIKKGDILFIHSDLSLLKLYRNKKDLKDTCKIILKQLLKAVGKNGTLVFPTFTYSFPNKKKYYPKVSKSICGYLSEYVKKLNLSKSYDDPNLSVVILGKHKNYLSKNPTVNSFADNGFFDKFYKLRGNILNINLDSSSTFIHFFERKLKVDYRYDKKFYGYIKNKKVVSKIYVLKEPKYYTASFSNFCRRAEKYYTTSKIGRGFVGKISLTDTFSIVKFGLKKNKKFLTKKI